MTDGLHIQGIITHEDEGPIDIDVFSDIFTEWLEENHYLFDGGYGLVDADEEYDV